MFISGVNDTGNEREKFLAMHFFHILFRTYLSPLYNYRLNFCKVFIFRKASIIITVLFITIVVDTDDKFQAFWLFLAGINKTGETILSPVSTTPPKNCSPVSTSQANRQS
jgi:hypothetical protein